MATTKNVYIDTGATGAGNGTSWTDAYTSHSAAEAAERAIFSNDLVAADTLLHFRFRTSTGVADSTYVIVSSLWVTDATRKIIFEVPEAYRHNGTRNSGAKIAFASSYRDGFRVQAANVEIIGYEMNITGTPDYGCINGDADNFIVRNCLCYGTTGRAGISGSGSADTKHYFVNNIIYGCLYGIWNRNSLTGYEYFNTILNCSQYGIYTPNYPAIYSKNNYIGGSTTADIHDPNSRITKTSTVCSDLTGNSQVSVADCKFTNSTAGSENAHIGVDSSLKWIGTDLSADANYPIGLDFEGETRPTTPSVGADDIESTWSAGLIALLVTS